MTIIEKQAFVPYTPTQMYDLVNDVAGYPSFLPWCASSTILNQTPTTMTAQLTVAKGPIRHAFTTQNTLNENKSIQMKLLKGPFQRLQGTWDFKQTPHGTEVRFYLHFEFASKLLALSFGPIFKQVTQTMMQSFIQRAKEIYG